HDGEITLDALTVRYRNLEPITDTVAGSMLLVNGTGGFNSVTIGNGGAGQNTISSPSFESVTFANKTTVTFDGGGGGDALNFALTTGAMGLTTLLVMNVATVTQTGAINLPKLGIVATGAITLDSSNTIGGFEAKTDVGD